ncbi:MAG: hypothetical protein KDK23_01415 [Leptospiraceae bacterium]|nr:hypothetical protein [Leptospiraceae bacterium]
MTEGSKVQSTARLKNKEPGGPKKQLLSGFFALVVLLLAGEACARDPDLPAAQCDAEKYPEFLILEREGTISERSSLPIRQLGRLEMKEQSLDPASTFKLALALVLLQDGFDPTTAIKVTDPYIKDTPRRIDLSEALLFSSNDYFRLLAREKGSDYFRRGVDQLNYYPSTIAADWLEAPSDAEDIVHGGNQRITPARQLLFIERILRNEVPKSDILLQQVRWPRSPQDEKARPDLSLFGKTGAFDRTVWFVGGMRNAHSYRAIVVVRRGHYKTRREAIRLFYCRMGQELPDHPLIPE